MFSYEFCEISKNTSFTEHLWTTASENLLKLLRIIFNQTFDALLWTYFELFLCVARHKKSLYSELFWSAFFQHFSAVRLNTKRYGVSLRIQSECEKMWTTITSKQTLFTHCGLCVSKTVWLLEQFCDLCPTRSCGCVLFK